MIVVLEMLYINTSTHNCLVCLLNDQRKILRAYSEQKQIQQYIFKNYTQKREGGTTRQAAFDFH